MLLDEDERAECGSIPSATGADWEDPMVESKSESARKVRLTSGAETLAEALVLWGERDAGCAWGTERER